MSFGSYREVLRIPGVGGLVALGLVARIPHATSGLVFSLHVVYTLNQGFARAGIAVTVLTIGLAFGAPWRGRAVDRVGLRRAVLPSVIIEAGAWIALPWASYELLLLASLAIGAFMVPVFPVIRQGIAAMVPRPLHQPALALDAVCTEITFIVGPILAAWLVTAYSSRAALIIVGAATVVAGVALMVANPPTRPDPLRHIDDAVADLGESIPPGVPGEVSGGVQDVKHTDDAGPPVPEPAARRQRLFTFELGLVLAATISGVFALAVLDLGIVAYLKEWDQTAMTGLVLALSAAGSAVGGLAYGAMSRSVHPLWMVLGLAAVTAPCAAATSVPLLGAAVFLAGFLCAPTFTAVNTSLARLVPDGRLGEAMGWNGTAMTVGQSLGAPICGFAIDAMGPPAGFLAAAALAALAAGTGLVIWRIRGTRRPRT
ncbi:MAG: MFS transporter [Bifidobacteriaceae bacterium]|nr:MFS transporter [Bifidobacteriaceae bacterium]